LLLTVLVDPPGKLIAYVFVKTNLPKDETLKLPFMIQPAPIPATQTLVPLTEKPDLVPSVALAAGPTDGTRTLSLLRSLTAHNANRRFHLRSWGSAVTLFPA
jgi:hypothetical protein